MAKLKQPWWKNILNLLIKLKEKKDDDKISDKIKDSNKKKAKALDEKNPNTYKSYGTC